MNIFIHAQIEVVPPPLSLLFFDNGGGQGGGQMLELHKSKAGAKTQSEMEVYERQIRAVASRESIDELVYALYGLSPDEIRIVEGKE